MRRRRLKLDSNTEDAYYHCISRTAGEQWLLKDMEKEVLRRQMWDSAEYCGVEIVTYTLMSNHYHILLKVPKRQDVSDTELLRLYEVLYRDLTKAQRSRLEEVKADMAVNGDLARRWRAQQLAQMFDVSQFNKLLKLRFSIWYNQTHERMGTLWAERFKSLLVEEGDSLKRVAAYIDLNCVRAHIVRDPKDYRFCGYSEAVAGHARARHGLIWLHHCAWEAASVEHRCMMFGILSSSREQKCKVEPKDWKRFVKTQGKLPMCEVLQHRIRYFVDGVILGSEAYVREKAVGFVSRRDWKPKAMDPVTDWAGLHVFSGMRSRLWE